MEKQGGKKRKCGYCSGQPRNIIDEDFCPRCGLPSQTYREFIEDDMCRNGELNDAMMALVMGF